MRATRKRKATADVSTPKSAAKSASKTATKAPRKRAPQIRNWLAFIRPHADRYEALPRGEQRKLIEKLSKKSGSSENTLRRYIAAARVLEAHGIRGLPEGRRYLPVASIEAIERIRKKDPERGRKLFADLLQGIWSAHSLKEELAATPRRVPRGSWGEVQKVWPWDVIRLVGELARTDLSEQSLVAFNEAYKGQGFNLFAKAAAPRFVALIAGGKRAAIFDEAVLSWVGGPALVTRKFLQNIAMATAMFDYVVVVCDVLMGEVQAVIAEMPQRCRDRVAVMNGILCSNPGNPYGKPKR